MKKLKIVAARLLGNLTLRLLDSVGVPAAIVDTCTLEVLINPTKMTVDCHLGFAAEAVLQHLKDTAEYDKQFCEECDYRLDDCECD